MTELPKHPGVIVYWDGDSGRVVNELTTDQIPEGSQYAPGENDVLVPVVKVVAYTTTEGREIHEYGPAGQLLRTTAQRHSR